MANNKNIMSKLLIIGVVISLSLSMPLFAQKIDATLRGRVLDTDGQVLPGVKIVVTNTKTGEEFTSYSSEFGRYLLPALPASVYEIKAELEGFATQVLKDVELKIGQEAIIDITLKLATVSETIVVTGEAPLIEVTKSQMSEVITRETIDNIPLKGRDFTDLMLLLPGASDSSDQSGTTGKVSFLGERTYTVSYLIDGASNDNDIDGGYVQDFNQDAIQEFEVIPDGYKAEYGKASGGVSNIITKSGTNEFHGRGFLFLRDDSMSWTSHEGQVLPKLRRYEYGGTFGGPIKKNKAWFFGSVELVPEDRGVTFVPEQYNLAAMERYVEGWDLGIVPQDRNYTYFGKINANLSDKHRLVANFNINDFNVINQGADFPGFTYDTVNTSYSLSGRDTWMMSDTTLMETTFKYLKHDYSAAKALLERAESGINHGYVRLRLWPYAGSPYAYVSSVTSVTTPRTQNDERIEAIWNLSKFIEDWNGAHDMKFGFDFSRVTISGERGQFKEAGQGAFGALYWPYDGNSPFSWVNTGYSAAHLRDEAISYYGSPDDFVVDVKNNQYGLFAQDSWQLKEGFTVNLGVRYDFESLFYEDKNNIAPRLGFAWDPWKDGKTVIRGSAGVFYDQNLMNAVLNDPDLGGTAIGVSFSFVYPRLGAGFFGDLSDWASSYGKDPYSMWGSLTGAYDYFGIPYNPNDPASWPIVSRDNVQELTGLTPDQFLAAMERLFPYYWSWSGLDGWLQCPYTIITGPSQVFIPIRPFKTTYTLSYAIGIERKLSDSTAVEIRYNYRNINNMLGTWITNLMPDGSGRTINNEPVKVQRAYYGWQRIHNVTATLERRLSKNVTCLASYAFNHNWTNMPNGIGYRPSNNLNVDEEQGPAGGTVAHNFVISGTYFFPLDISVSGIFRWRSGTVYGPGTARWDPDGDGSGGTPPADRWPSDDVPNANCFSLPSWKNVDLRVQKNFKFGRYNAAVLAEFFNLFNFDNVESTKGGIVVLPGNYFQLAADYFTAWSWSRGREMQIGLRFDF
jgi:outer membrane receptor protein involved in Fe transport